MVAEEQKYRAYTYNIAGFALLTPLGKLILDPVATATILEKFGPLIFVGYVSLCIILAIGGCRAVDIGRDILDM